MFIIDCVTGNLNSIPRFCASIIRSRLVPSFDALLGTLMGGLVRLAGILDCVEDEFASGVGAQFRTWTQETSQTSEEKRSAYLLYFELVI